MAGRKGRLASLEIGTNRPHPDLAIEVVVTSGGINKLEAYKRLQIAEVWFWEKCQLTVYALQAEGYAAISQSSVLPGLEMSFLLQGLDEPDHLTAVRQFRRAVTASVSGGGDS